MTASARSASASPTLLLGLSYGARSMCLLDPARVREERGVRKGVARCGNYCSFAFYSAILPGEWERICPRCRGLAPMPAGKPAQGRLMW